MIGKIKQSGLVIVIACLVCFLCFISVSLGQELIPAPGTVIDKSNIDKYKHLFPDDFYRAFTDGWGVAKPLVIKVKETVKEMPVLEREREASEKNRGKYQLDSEGYIATDYRNIVGLPFPGVDPSDPDFAVKLMWNYDLKYQFDSIKGTDGLQMSRRKGERIALSLPITKRLSLTNRLFDDPKPYISNRNNCRRMIIIRLLYPPSIRDTMQMIWEPIDPRQESVMFVYVPSLRRTMRAETGESSTPVPMATTAPDDMEIFGGRIPDFNFKFIKEQKVLAVPHAKQFYMDTKHVRKVVKDLDHFPIQTDTWEVRDVYVIEITSKDPLYPQSKKLIYIEKEHPIAYYGVAYDRAGELWKVWMAERRVMQIKSGEKMNRQWSQFGIDIQMGFTEYAVFQKETVNGFDYNENMFTSNSLRQMAR